MKRRLKKIALLAGATLLLLGLLAGVAVRLLDVDRYRSRAQIAISEATGLDCSLGRLSLSLWPLLNLHVDQPALSHAGQPILRAERITATAHLLPLLTGRLAIETVIITRLTGTIVRDRQGNLNLLPPRKPQPDRGLPLTGLTIAHCTLENAELRYQDAATGFKAAAIALDLDAGPFAVVEQGQAVYPSGRDFMAAAAFSGNMKAKTLAVNTVTLDRPALHFEYARNALRLDPLTATIYGGKTDAALTLADLAATPRLDLICTIDGLDLARVTEASQAKQRMSGRLHLAMHLAARGTSRQTLLRQMDGTLTMHGSRLTIQGLDLDTVLSQYAKSQSLGLFDLGSIFIIGPFGPLLSKAFDLSGAAIGAGRGSSEVMRLVSDWTMSNGIASTRDVALATPRHRLAFSGRLDIPAARFADFRVAVVDSRGCATFTQTVNGTFHDPEIAKANLLAKTVVTPLLSLFQKGATVLSGGKAACTPFYRGSVPHPAAP